jgi:hypothetical protein
MTGWTADQLAAIAGADELRIAPLRRDGAPRVPVPVWVVRHGDGLFVRTWRASGSAWHRSARASRQGRVRAGGVEADVTFAEETDPAVNDQIDAAYRAKYGRYGSGSVEPMVTSAARATTLRLIPR